MKNVLIVQHVENEGPGLIEWFLKDAKIPYQVICPDSGDSIPAPGQFSHVVLLGGPMGVYEEERYPFLKAEDFFVKEAIQIGLNILGICLGAQLIAKALGAKVTRAPMKEIGWYEVRLTEHGLEDPLFCAFPQNFWVFQWHEDSFELPSGAKLLVTSSGVSNQAFRFADNIYALQFHIEVTSEMIARWLKEYSESKDFSEPELSSLTGRDYDSYRRRGIEFLGRFFAL